MSFESVNSGPPLLQICKSELQFCRRKLLLVAPVDVRDARVKSEKVSLVLVRCLRNVCLFILSNLDHLANSNMPLIGLSLGFQNRVRKFSVQHTLLTFGRNSSLIEEEGGIDLNPDKKLHVSMEGFDEKLAPCS